MRHRSRTRALALWISLSLSFALASPLTRRALAAQAPAVSEDDQAEGKRLFEKGLLRYDTAEYDEAIRLFRAAYERTRAPALLFNMAQAYRLKDDCRKAVDLYHQFVRMDPESPDRARAESRLAMMEPCAPLSIAVVQTTTAAPAPVSLIAVREAPPESPAHARGSQMRATGVVLGGVAVAVAAAGGVFWKKAANDEEEITTLFASHGAWDAHAADVDADGRGAQQTAGALFVTAGVAAVLGAASYLYGWRLERSSASR